MKAIACEWYNRETLENLLLTKGDFALLPGLLPRFRSSLLVPYLGLWNLKVLDKADFLWRKIERAHQFIFAFRHIGFALLHNLSEFSDNRFTLLPILSDLLYFCCYLSDLSLVHCHRWNLLSA